MKFTFTEKKMGTSEELRSYTERKVGKLDRFFKTESSAKYHVQHGARQIPGRDHGFK